MLTSKNFHILFKMSTIWLYLQAPGAMYLKNGIWLSKPPDISTIPNASCTILISSISLLSFRANLFPAIIHQSTFSTPISKIWCISIGCKLNAFSTSTKSLVSSMMFTSISRRPKPNSFRCCSENFLCFCQWGPSENTIPTQNFANNFPLKWILHKEWDGWITLREEVVK